MSLSLALLSDPDPEVSKLHKCHCHKHSYESDPELSPSALAARLAARLVAREQCALVPGYLAMWTSVFNVVSSRLGLPPPPPMLLKDKSWRLICPRSEA